MFNPDQVQRIKELLLKQLKDELSSSEDAELRTWTEISAIRNAFIQEITDEHALNEKLQLFTQIEAKDIREQKKVWDAITSTDNSPAHRDDSTPVPSRRGWRYAAASVLLLVGVTVVYFVLPPRETRQDHPVYVEAGEDIAPGKDKAVLTLSGGKHIVLDSAAVGYLASQGNTVISKDGSGQLVYNMRREEPAETEPQWSTITTPKGGQYHMVLPDSTEVWLNSASSITFSTPFTGLERNVEITGECYFEVAHDPDKPFKVDVAGQMQLKVLGTSFNVMAYPDERLVAATLLDGSLLVRSGEQTAAGMGQKTPHTKLLKPGQQARVPAIDGHAQSDLRIVDLANPEDAISWKNGLLSFRNADIRPIMRQIARWYNLEVIYSGDVPAKHYSGNILRETKLTEALEVLHLVSGAWFEVRGRELIVEFPRQ